MRKISILTLVLLLGGCQQYVTRSDFISPYSGDALAANKSNQTIDPWHPYAYDRDVHTSAERQAYARQNYEQQGKPDAEVAPQQILLVPPTTK